MLKKKKLLQKLLRFWNLLGPGLITGSSDDDPSSIVTYSQAGAAFGLSTLWTILVTLPLKASIQEMCARIGLVTSKGLAGILKEYYPRPVLYLMLLFSIPAIIMNISADIAGMGAVANLLFPSINSAYFNILFTLLLLVLIIYLPYHRFVLILKYLSLVLLLYLIIPFLYKQNLWNILKGTFIPTITFDKNFVSILVAILGTTISPYLFFWQASMEVEEMKNKKRHLIVNKKIIRKMREDVDFGMLFSNLITFFIILTTGTVLFNGGIRQIDTVEQAARVLKPLAGNIAYLLFAIGIIGTGLLAIPVLSGSLSYIIAETFGWQEGLNKKFHEAKAFYLIIIISLIIGLSLDYIGVSPVKALIYSAILYGLTASPLILIVLHISNNKKIMGKFTNRRLSNIFGFTTLILMSIVSLVLIYLQIQGLIKK